MYQRNVIASFRDYDDANAAASELSRAGFGDVQVRILPPRTTYGRYQAQQVIVSAILNTNHVRAAERILALNGGAIDLHEDANWGGDRWDDRRGGFTAPNRQPRQQPQYDRAPPHRESWLHNIPWGAVAGATMAALSGYALYRGVQLYSDEQHEDYAPGQIRRDSRAFRSAASSQRRALPSRSRTSQVADEAELAWGDHEADDTAPNTAAMYDRPSGSAVFQTGAPVRTPSNQGFGSGQNATANDGGSAQVGVGSGSSITQGLSQGARSGSNLGAGSASGTGSRLGAPAAHGRDQAGTAATQFAHE